MIEITEVLKDTELLTGYRVVTYRDMSRADSNIIRYYNVELLRPNGSIVAIMHTGCIGQKSAEYWSSRVEEHISRIIQLSEDKRMACHNRYCYSKDMFGLVPKEKYEREWMIENDRILMLDKWMLDMSNYWGNDNRSQAIQIEWEIGGYNDGQN